MKEDMQEKYMEYQMLMQQMQQLRENNTALEKHVAVLFELKENLNKISSVKPESDTLVTLGNGVFFNAQIKECKKVIMNVGAGVFLEKNMDNAISVVDKQMNEVAAVLSEIKDEINKTSNKIYQLQKETN